MADVVTEGLLRTPQHTDRHAADLELEREFEGQLPGGRNEHLAASPDFLPEADVAADAFLEPAPDSQMRALAHDLREVAALLNNRDTALLPLSELRKLVDDSGYGAQLSERHLELLRTRALEGHRAELARTIGALLAEAKLPADGSLQLISGGALDPKVAAMLAAQENGAAILQQVNTLLEGYRGLAAGAPGQAEAPRSDMERELRIALALATLDRRTVEYVAAAEARLSEGGDPVKEAFLLRENLRQRDELAQKLIDLGMSSEQAGLAVDRLVVGRVRPVPSGGDLRRASLPAGEISRASVRYRDAPRVQPD